MENQIHLEEREREHHRGRQGGREILVRWKQIQVRGLCMLVSMRESYHADSVGPLVIVVSDQLDEVRVQQHRGADVHNAGALVVIEIRTHCLVLSVSDN
jgi:hypothetical protein